MCLSQDGAISSLDGKPLKFVEISRCIYQPHHYKLDATQDQFLVEFYKFEFGVFLLLDQLSHQD